VSLLAPGPASIKRSAGANRSRQIAGSRRFEALAAAVAIHGGILRPCRSDARSRSGVLPFRDRCRGPAHSAKARSLGPHQRFMTVSQATSRGVGCPPEGVAARPVRGAPATRVFERMQQLGARADDGRVGRRAFMSKPTPPTTAPRGRAGNASLSVGAAFLVGFMRPGARRPSASHPPFTRERESRSTCRQACERESCMFTLATCRCRFHAPACLPTQRGTVTSVMARRVFRELGAASAPPGAVTECSSYLGPQNAGTQGYGARESVAYVKGHVAMLVPRRSGVFLAPPMSV
jgi:hypothetical protein